jgi:predicted FMN-binding regulatory protein PaiB
MYLPTHYAETDPARLHALMHEHPLARHGGSEVLAVFSGPRPGRWTTRPGTVPR